MVKSLQTRKRRVVLAGATGWAGSALAKGIATSGDLDLVGAVSRQQAGRRLGDVLGVDDLDTRVSETVEEALEASPDVFVDYTKPDVAKSHVLSALGEGAHVVIGTSGLSESDYEVVDQATRESGLGVLACGNFALSAVLMMKFSEMAAKWLKSWEIVDYASAGKADAPSGTARELAHRMAAVGRPDLAIPISAVQGEKEARGADLGGIRVHSIRLPGYVLSIESHFGAKDERLTIRHDAGSSAEPYVEGALLAIRRVDTLVGLHRGLDCVMKEREE